MNEQRGRAKRYNDAICRILLREWDPIGVADIPEAHDLPSEVPDLRWEVAIRRPEARRRAGSHSLSGSSSVALPAAGLARASAARLFRVSCDAENWRAQCVAASAGGSGDWMRVSAPLLDRPRRAG
jgi:hypothetical protein